MDSNDIVQSFLRKARSEVKRKYPQLSGAELEAHLKAYLDKRLNATPQKRSASNATLVMSDSKRPTPVCLRPSRIAILV